MTNIYSSDEDYDNCFISKKRKNIEDELDENILKKYNINERKKFKKEYEEIKEKINYIPSVFDILETNASIKDKYLLMQHLDILINLDKYSYDYMVKKNYLIEQIEKMKNQDKPNKNNIDNIEKNLLKILDSNISLKNKILKANIGINKKAVIYEKYLKLNEMDPNHGEYYKIKEWIEYALKLPTENKKLDLPNITESNKKINTKLNNIQKKLDSKLYGMNNVKEEILLILNNKITNNNNIGNALALLGPPGTGKTCIIRTLAESLDIPFVQISLGGMTDTSYLEGHSYTYEGATPGIIAKSLMEMKYNNGIIFFDEIDKLSESEKGKEVAWNLLHITDFTQNNNFRDKYLCDIEIDLSKIWFIYSMNDETFMDKALKDRLPIIKVSGYNKKEKKIIAKEYIIPKILENINMDKKIIEFDDNVLEYIISITKNGNTLSGVRELEKMLNRILSKINLYKNVILKNGEVGDLKLTYEIKNFKIPLKLTNKIIDELIKNYIKKDISYNMYI